jgi:hypothetical protein
MCKLIGTCTQQERSRQSLDQAGQVEAVLGDPQEEGGLECLLSGGLEEYISFSALPCTSDDHGAGIDPKVVNPLQWGSERRESIMDTLDVEAFILTQPAEDSVETIGADFYAESKCLADSRDCNANITNVL